MLTESPDSQIAKDPQRRRTQDLQGGWAALALVTDLLLEPLAMGLHKGPTSQDHSIGKVTNLAAQPFLEREFALLLVNDRLGLWPGQRPAVMSCCQARRAKTDACDTLRRVAPGWWPSADPEWS